MSSLYDSAQASKADGAQFYPLSTSMERTSPYEQSYRWSQPSSGLSSSSPAMNESLRAQHSSYAVEPPLTSSNDHRNSLGQRPTSSIPHYYYNSASQNVPVNFPTTLRQSSTVPRTHRPSSTQLESHLSRHTPSHHVSITQSPQPPPQVYSELFAHYGTSQSLSRPPPTYTDNQQSRPFVALPEFQSLRKNYLTMLSQESTDKTTPMLENPTATEMVDSAATSATPSRKVDEELLSNLDTVVETMLASPEYRSRTFEEFLTSPFDNSTPYDDFNASPLDDSPFNADLNTPIMNDISDDFGMYSSEYSGLPLFNDDASSLYQIPADPEVTKKSDEPPNSAKLYLISPSTPSLDAVNPTSLYHSPHVLTAPLAPPMVKSAPSPAPTPEPESTTRRRTLATGTRKNLTPAALIPLDAPTQTRKYITPSATSRKEVPAVFAKKKRVRSQAFDEEDELASEEARPLHPTEKEQIEWKRRQNTISARKSRKRKLEHTHALETELATTKAERDLWKDRAFQLEKMLETHNIAFEPFEG